jgi:hypothetical protein
VKISDRADEVQYVKSTSRSFHDPQRVVKSVLMMNASLGRCKDAVKDSISESGLAWLGRKINHNCFSFLAQLDMILLFYDSNICKAGLWRRKRPYENCLSFLQR